MTARDQPGRCLSPPSQPAGWPSVDLFLLAGGRDGTGAGGQAGTGGGGQAGTGGGREGTGAGGRERMGAGGWEGTGAGAALRDVVDYARAAERAGFAGVWLAEHHFIRYGSCPSATVLASHLLAATERIAVGTAACVLSDRHPVALGEEAALLDALAPGRFRLGVARGGPWVDLEVFGTGLPRFERGFAESLDLLLRWLSGADRVAANGEFFRFREVPVVPRPDRPLPVWVAATSNSTVDIAAARGLPLLLGVHDDDASKALMLRRYADTAAADGRRHPGPAALAPAALAPAALAPAGRHPAVVRPAGPDPVDPGPAGPWPVEHASAHLVCLADTAAAGRRRLRATLPGWLAATAGYVRIDGSEPPRRDIDAYIEHLLRIHPVGPPDACADRLRATVAATGVRHLLLMVEAAGDRAAVLDAITALGAELLPRLHAHPDRPDDQTVLIRATTAQP